MERIVLRHLSGSKTNQVEEFPLSHFNELSIGRDPSVTVKYDPDRDDLIGRQHAKITRDTVDPTVFSITDLSSRNGTFLNKQRIVGTVRVNPGDIIQLGAGGPEFQFDVEPRLPGMVRPTRVGSEAATLAPSATPPTRVVGAAQVGAAASAPASTRVGKATVERMISQTRSESRKWVAIAGAALLFAVVLIAAGLYIKSRRDAQLAAQQGQKTSEEITRLGSGLGEVTKRTEGRTAGEIAEADSPATVYIQVSWQLIDSRSGSPVFFKFVPNRYRDQQGKMKPLVQDQRQYVAAWKVVQTGQGNKIEPFLTTNSNDLVLPVGSSHTGSGFCVTGDGFIITNRHVAATWQARYQGWGDYSFPAVILKDDGTPYLGQDGNPIIIGRQNWVPAETEQFGSSVLGQPAVQGRNDSLYVTFLKTELRIPAKLVRTSDRHDVAMIKIDIPEPVKKVELNDNYDTIKLGDSVVVLGYPGGSPPLVAIIGSKTSRGAAVSEQVGIIPDPTLSVGNISRVVRGQEPVPGKDPLTGKDTIISTIGDIYQLNINTTGGGNSGGPVFDDRGRVIAIYTYGIGSDFQASGAVPIRYAKELMGVTQIMK